MDMASLNWSGFEWDNGMNVSAELFATYDPALSRGDEEAYHCGKVKADCVEVASASMRSTNAGSILEDGMVGE